VGTVRLGIIGCGVIGTHHLQAATACPDIEVVAVADRIAARREAARQSFGVGRLHVEGLDLLADPAVEAVVVAVPAGDRIELPEVALRAGKHVLIEKPTAVSCQRLNAYLAAQGPRVAASCSSRYATLGSTQAAAAVVASGVLGQLRTVYCRNFSPAGLPPATPPPDWRLSRERNGGGILCNWGCYDLDYLMTITGWSLRPRRCLAAAWPVGDPFRDHVAPGSDAESHYTGLLLCDGGTVISLERGEYMPATGQSAWQIIGARGSLRLAMTAQGGPAVWHDEGTSDQGVVSRAVWDQAEDYAAVHSGPVTDFAHAILTGAPPRTDLRRALLVQTITDAIYRSASTGAAVDIDA
jgi:predicted dehydrogenase